MFKHIQTLPLVRSGSKVSSFFISSIVIAETLAVKGTGTANANVKFVYMSFIRLKSKYDCKFKCNTVIHAYDINNI